MKPEEYYLEILNHVGNRKKNTLEKIQNICIEESKNKNPDFSLSHIADKLKEHGGITEQGLRNKNALEYRNLIQCWKSAYGKEKNINTSKDEYILDSITDHTIRALVGMLISENKQLKKQNNIYKNQTVFHIDMRPDIKTNSIIEKPYALTETELDALRKAISTEFMEKQGWVADEYGRVKKGDEKIYDIGYVTAIKRILEEYDLI
ncbi:MAG: hypothetical protein K6E27_14725 [Eubacterium sp.]|nr:hypothetical protein [Eubacterium sp.]